MPCPYRSVGEGALVGAGLFQPSTARVKLGVE